MPAKSRSPQNKLCLSVRIVVPAHELLRSLTLRVLKDNAVLQKIAVDEQQLTAASNSTEDKNAFRWRNFCWYFLRFNLKERAP